MITEIVHKCVPVHIALLGAEGCGKTSLLAAMHRAIEQSSLGEMLDKIYVDLNSDTGLKTATRLSSLRQAQQVAISATASGSACVLPHAQQDTRLFEFVAKGFMRGNLLSRNKTYHYPVIFDEIPFKWLNESDEDSYKEATDSLQKAHTSVVVVDTPSLMKGPASCIRINNPTLVHNFYQGAMEHLKSSPRSLVFVLTKCEKFWHSKEIMLKNLKDVYRDLIKSCMEAGFNVCVTWCKTLGGIEFASYPERASSCKAAAYIKTGNYAPENLEAVADLIFSETLANMAEDCNKQLSGVLSVFEKDAKLATQAAAKLAEQFSKKLGTSLDNKYHKF